MKKRNALVLRVIKIFYLLSVHTLAAAFLIQYFILPRIGFKPIALSQVADPQIATAVPTPLSAPDELFKPIDNTANASPASSPSQNDVGPPSALAQNMIVPVAGIERSQLRDTFGAARSEGRSHEAIDIMAPAGTPVLAAADGKIVKFFDSTRGGITIYQLSADSKYFYYYAHLRNRADNIKEGDFVRQGTIIGNVGDTGNAGAGNFHLHFGVTIAGDPKRYWEGEALNPYPLLAPEKP